MSESDGQLEQPYREVLDFARRELARCTDGLEEAALDAIKRALARVVPFDRIALSVVDATGSSSWIRYRALAVEGSGPPPALNLLTRMPRTAPVPAEVLARGANVRESLDPNDPVDKQLIASGIHSYLAVPIVHEGGELGWLALSHERAGAPSQIALPLLKKLGALLAPALARSHVAERARLYAALVDGSPDAMLAIDRGAMVVEANAAALALLKRSRETTMGRPLAEILGEEGATTITSAIRTAAESTPPLSIEVTTPSGERVPLDAVVGTVRDVPDATHQVHLRDARLRRAADEATSKRVDHLAFLRDVAEAMAGDLRVQTALERAADACMRRKEISSVLMFRAGENGALKLVVARGASAELAGMLERVAQSDLERMLSSNASEVKRTHGGVIEAEGARLDPVKTGAIPRWKVFVPFVHARRPLGGLMVFGRIGDVLTEDERRLWQSLGGSIGAALHAADDFDRVVALEAEKRQLVDNLPVVVARVDPKTGATIYVSGAVERVLGYTPQELLGEPGMEALFADPIEWEASAVARDRAARGHEAGWQDRRYKHKDGRTVTLRECVYPVRDATGAARAIEVLAYDVTNEIESRKQLMQADRLASLGALAAGIAHEINNPVAFIALAAGQIEKMLDQARGAADGIERTRGLLHEVGEAATRIANIVGELKLFTRIPEGAISTPIDVNRIVQMAVTLTSAELRRRARVEMSLGELPLVPGEYSSLGHAFVNLLLNAAQAIDARGSGSVSSNTVSVTTLVQDDAIIVRVRDTGVGIEPRVLPRIFDPFFKTKASGAGAGLGLAIAHNLVRRVGGDIRVTSKPGEGSTFDVVLPLHVELEANRPSSGLLRSAPPISIAPVSTRGRVLIVDDEPALAKALARQLSAHFDVDTVSTASDALAELAVHSYDAVVCDVRMPDQSGPAIYDATLARSPKQAARFIFITGGSYGSEDDEIHARAEATKRPILEKPFDGASFEALVTKVSTATI